MSLERSLHIADRSRALDGLRGLCVFAVLYVHSLSHFTPMGSAMVGPLSFGTFATNLGFAVTIFFGMSGYVLMLPYAQGRPFKAREFYKKRALRLLPLLWFATIVSLLMYPLPPYIWNLLWHIPFATYTFFLDFLRPNGVTNIPGNPALWTLSVEIILSLLVPLFIFRLRTGSAYLCAIFAAFTIALGLGWIEFLTNYRFFDPLYIHAIAAFFLGLTVFLAGCYLSLRPQWMVRNANLCFVLGLLGTLTILFTPVDSPSSIVGDAMGSPARFCMLFIKYEVLKIASTFCLIAGVLWGTWRLPSRVLTWRVLRWPGIMCYSIYIWHMPMFGHFGKGFMIHTFGEAVPVVLYLWLVVFLIAIPSYFLFEKTSTTLPFLKRHYARLRNRTALPQPTV